jgi:transcriptional regulator with XRE-family HTH domain
MKGGLNMDQIKIGSFLKELRMEKGLTQAKLAEQLNTTNRSVSRWETGSTLPDISILIELADFYEVDIKEIIDGERKSEKMTDNLKETLVTVADYSKRTNNKKMAKVIVLLSLIFVVLLTLIIIVFGSRSRGIDNSDMYPVYRQVYIDKEVTDELLSDYILSERSKSEPYSDSENAANFTAFAIFSTEEKSSGNYYVYAWVIESTYSFDASVLSEQSGASYPCRFELISENNTFKVVNADIPRDGGYYTEDINKLFPEYLREKIYNVHDDGTLNELRDSILDEAKDYFGIK